jgi:hypothetical protein
MSGDRSRELEHTLGEKQDFGFIIVSLDYLMLFIVMLFLVPSFFTLLELTMID